MSSIKSLRKKYLREDNQRIWLPMLGSIILQYASVFINQIFVSNRLIYWILFSVSIAAGLLFLLFSVKYVEQWHQRLALFNIKENDLLSVGSFLIAMSRSKSFNHYELKKLTAEYKLTRPEEFISLENETRTYFPFTIKQTVEGTARGTISQYYFHMTANPTNRREGHIKVEYKTDGRDYKKLDLTDGSQKQIKCYTLVANDHHKNDNIVYKIKSSFEKSAGISADQSNRLYLYPANFSKNYGKVEVYNTYIYLDVPSEYREYMNDPKLRIIGEKGSQTPFGRIASFSDRDQREDGSIRFSKQLKADENTLILIEFEKKILLPN